jgi:hypothetical protein
MLLTRDGSAVNFIRSWEPGRVRIADRWIAGNVLVGNDAIIESWTTSAAARLTIADLEPRFPRAVELAQRVPADLRSLRALRAAGELGASYEPKQSQSVRIQCQRRNPSRHNTSATPRRRSQAPSVKLR